MLRMGRTVSPLCMLSRTSNRKTDNPSVFFVMLGKGVVRARSNIKSECCTRDIHTFCPFTIYLSPRFSAKVLVLVVSVPVVGSVTANDWRRNAPDAIRGRYLRFCSGDPCRNRAPIVYICA